MSDRVLRYVKQRCYCNSGSGGHDPRQHHHCEVERKMPRLTSYLDEDSENNQIQSTSSSRAADTNYIFKAPTTPFELPHVFGEILQYMPLKDWKNCRLVSPTWLAACSNPRPLAKFRFIIPDIQRLKTLVSGKGKTEWGRSPMPTLFEDVKLPAGVPLDNKYLVSFLHKFGVHIKRLYIPDGWSIVGLQCILFDHCVNLEELHLMGKVPQETHRLIWTTGDGAQTTPRPKLSNLKKLVLELLNANSEMMQDTAPGFPQGFILSSTNPIAKLLITDLLCLTPNLEWVQCPTRRDLKRDPSLCSKLAASHGLTAHEVEGSFNRVNQFLAQKLFSFAHGYNPKINGLQLYLRLNGRGMDKLSAKGYPLQTVDLHIRSVDKQGLMDLLPKLGNTLKNLRLTVDNKFHFDFPCGFFTELQTLRLEDYAGDLQFISDLPKLKSLTLGFFNSALFIKTPVLPCPNSKLTSLTLELEELLAPYQQARCIKKLSTFFPHLLKLNLDKVSDKDLLRMYDCLPHLEELNMKCTSVSNGGITGFTDTDTEAILDAGYEQHKFQEYEKLRRLPYIGDLKSLKSLTMTGQLNLLSSRFATGRMANTLQSLSILHGLCALSNLRALTLHDATISATEMKQLIRKLRLSRLELVDCRIDPAVLGWVKKKVRDTALEFVNRKD